MDDAIVYEIQRIIKQKEQELKISYDDVRTDVFSILKRENCVILYYPIEDTCAGCHVERTINSKKIQCIFINTIDKIERQRFTAAHELGHMWHVDDLVEQNICDLHIAREDIINRFAAELLMPQEKFRKELKNYINYNDFSSKISHNKLLDLITYLMNVFFTPYKSVLKRLMEFKCISKDTYDCMCEYNNSEKLECILKEKQYVQFTINNKESKMMGDLPALLEKAFQNELINKTKLEAIKLQFDIPKNIPQDKNFDEIIFVGDEIREESNH